jgi:hypothetical protein
MSKLKGSYKSADNIEVVTSHPLDPRVKWDSWDSLTQASDWPIDSEGNPYLYSGLIVSVNEGTSWEVYILNDISGWNIKFGVEGSGWKKVTSDGLSWEDETNEQKKEG